MVTAGVSSKVPLAKFAAFWFSGRPAWSCMIQPRSSTFWVLTFYPLEIPTCICFSNSAMAFDYWFSWASQLQAGTWPWDLGRFLATGLIFFLIWPTQFDHFVRLDNPVQKRWIQAGDELWYQRCEGGHVQACVESWLQFQLHAKDKKMQKPIRNNLNKWQIFWCFFFSDFCSSCSGCTKKGFGSRDMVHGELSDHRISARSIAGDWSVVFLWKLSNLVVW